MRATRESRSGRGKLAAAVAVIVALTAGFFAFAPSAFAHHPVLSGEAQCESDGTFTVNWNVGNSETSAERWMLVRAFSVSPDLGTTTGLVADGLYSGPINPVDYTGPGTLVAPNASVAATTTGIPGDTDAITLTVTGKWKYGNQQVTSTQSVRVNLGGECNPPTGSLSISKVVTGNTAPPGATYTIGYDNGEGTSGSVTVQGGETATVDDLPYGSYTLTEIDAPPGATISPNPAVIGDNHPDVKVTVTNPYPNVGSFSVTKHVTGETDGYVEDSTFSVSYDCSNGSDGVLTLADGETETVNNLPVGTTCTLAETDKPDTTDPSYAFGPEAFVPSANITIANTTNVSVTLNNPITRVLGSFSVTKHVTGETDGYVEDSTFSVSYDCSNGSEGVLTLADGETETVNNLPVGTTCTLAETDKPDTSGPSYVFGPEAFVPSNIVTIADESNVAVTLNNPIERRFGGITVSKNVTGAVEGYVAGSTFGFTLDCPGTEHDESFTLEAGDTESFSGIPLGTTCTVTEVDVPDPVPGYEYQTPVLTPADGTVTVNSTTTPVTVTVDNPLVWLPEPSATVERDCESGGVLVTLRNLGGGEVDFQVLVDDEEFGPVQTVGSEGEQTVLVPLDEDESATITVEADGFGVVTEEFVEMDCQNPAAAFAVECVEGGVVVTLTNDGESPVELTVSKDGEEVTKVVVGDEPVEVLVPMVEDETSTITVTDGDVPIDEQDMTYDCLPPDTIPPASVTTVEVLGTTEGPLPQTGSNVFGLVAVAAGLILLGASLVGVTRRRS